MRVPTVKLEKGDEFVIVEPGSEAFELWSGNGYAEKKTRGRPKAKKPAEKKAGKKAD